MKRITSICIFAFCVAVILSGCSQISTSAKSDKIISLDAGWRSNVVGGNNAVKDGTSADISFIRVTEAAEERWVDIMTLQVNLAAGNEWKLGEFILEGEQFVKKLRNANGIKFTVIGDGKAGWKVMFPMKETVSDSCWHEADFPTKIGQSVNIDIPFSQLTQPDWGRSVTFNRSSITSIIFQRFASDNKLSGTSAIKIYNLEIY